MKIANECFPPRQLLKITSSITALAAERGLLGYTVRVVRSDEAKPNRESV